MKKKRLLLFVFVGLIIGFIIINSNVSYAIDSPKVNLDCNNADNKTIECRVLLNTSGQKIASINANYDFPKEVAFISFDNKDCSNSCFTKYGSTEEGFAYLNKDGVVGDNILVGTLKLEKKTTFNNLAITLKDIELSDMNYKMISVRNVISKISN